MKKLQLLRDVVRADTRSYREIAVKAGLVSTSTLYRVANGKTFDIQTLRKLVIFYTLDANAALGLPTSNQYRKGRKQGWLEAARALFEAEKDWLL